MLNQIKNIALNLIGRRITYRLGRAMYLHARGDIANDMATNGEALIQACVLEAWKKKTPVKGERLVIFDVGANIGDWSAALLRQMKDRGVEEHTNIFSFEPVPSTAETLRRNLAGNRPFLQIEELALSSSSGTGEICIAGSNAGTNSLHEDEMSDQNKRITINLTTSSDFCEASRINHVHLLKSDTEGHDMDVIRGSLRLLKAERISVLQFEYNHRWVFSRNFLRDVFVATKSMPYKVVKLQADHLLVFENWHPELDKFFEGNYALIHSDALTWFPTVSVGFDRWNTLSTTQIK